LATDSYEILSVFLRQYFGYADISLLRGLVTAHQEQEHCTVEASEINAVTGATVYPQLEQAFAKRNTVAPVPIPDPSKPNLDMGSPNQVAERVQPTIEAGRGKHLEAMPKLYHLEYTPTRTGSVLFLLKWRSSNSWPISEKTRRPAVGAWFYNGNQLFFDAVATSNSLKFSPIPYGQKVSPRRHFRL
jgi:hypothetical protein